MLNCSNCGQLIAEFRPKFFMVLEKVNPLPKNVKEITCPKCGGLNYALNLAECALCDFFKPLYNPLSPGQVLSLGCRGQCLSLYG
ncbi:hypothetical protein CEB3_c02320 [Peptococcaceae bacterium CEB3]|nr:hypothetical protein CEB3_c02320 [Peptococcaceae bacterium CEB3]